MKKKFGKKLLFLFLYNNQWCLFFLGGVYHGIGIILTSLVFFLPFFHSSARVRALTFSFWYKSSNLISSDKVRCFRLDAIEIIGTYFETF